MAGAGVSPIAQLALPSHACPAFSPVTPTNRHPHTQIEGPVPEPKCDKDVMQLYAWIEAMEQQQRAQQAQQQAQ